MPHQTQKETIGVYTKWRKRSSSCEDVIMWHCISPKFITSLWHHVMTSSMTSSLGHRWPISEALQKHVRCKNLQSLRSGGSAKPQQVQKAFGWGVGGVQYNRLWEKDGFRFRVVSGECIRDRVTSFLYERLLWKPARARWRYEASPLNFGAHPPPSGPPYWLKTDTK